MKILNLQLGLRVLAVILCLPTTVLAAPPAELERLEYFVGEWSCQQPADNPEPSGEFIWNVELGLNNYWYLGNSKQALTPDDGQAIDTQEFLGYDSAAQKLIRSVVVSNGNSYNLTADDWQDEMLVWQGIISLAGKSTALRQEMVRDSEDRFITSYFVLGKDNNWLPIVDESCDRRQ